VNTRSGRQATSGYVVNLGLRAIQVAERDIAGRGIAGRDIANTAIWE
jgi:hypothetical protein